MKRDRVDRRVGVVLLSAATAIFAVGMLVAIGWPTRGYRNSDFMQYYAGSRALAEGASPYDLAWWRAFHERMGSIVNTGPPHTGDPSTDWTTPYPLWTFTALLPFALLPFELAAPTYAVVQVLLVLAAVVTLAATVLRQPRRVTPLLIALVAASQPLWILTVGGNVTGFAAAALTFALAALLSGRALLAGVLLAGCLLKPHLFVLGVCALVLGAPRTVRARLLLGASAGAAALIVPTFVLLPGWLPDWIHASGRLQDTSLSNATGWTLVRPFTADFVTASAVVIGLALVALLGWWWRARPDVVRLVAAAMPASVLVAPHGWSYDYIALLPSLVVGLAVASESRRRLAMLLLVALFVVVAPWALYIVALSRNGEDLSAFVLLGAQAVMMLAVRPPAAD